ncbi:hypothetical protein ABPG77_006678 [Micractinium sp. CCAP 211/92]
MEELETTSLATQHSLLLEERLRGAVHGPTSFSGLFNGTANRVNEYASFLGSDEDAEHGDRAVPLQRWVSNIGRIMPAGVQIEPRKLEIGMPPPARRAAAGAPSVPQPRPQQPPPHPQHPPQQHQQQRAEQPASQRPHAGGLSAVAEAPPEQPAPAPEPIARAAPVPGNPLKIRLKFARGSSVPRGSPDKPISPEAAAALVQSARQLGAGLHPPLSPIPAGWAHVVSCATPPPTAQGGAAGAGGGAISPFETVSAEEFGQLASGSAEAAAPAAGGALTVPAGPAQEPAGQLPQQAGLPAQPASDAAPGRSEPQREQQAAQPQQQQQQQESERRQGAHTRQPSPPAAAAGAKRPTPPAQPSNSAAQGPGPAVKRRKSPAAAGAPEPAAAAGALAAASPAVTDTPGVLPEGSVAPSTGPTGGSHPLARLLNNNTAAVPAAAQQQPAAHAAVSEHRRCSATPTGEQRPSAAEPQQPQQQAVPQWAAEALAGRSDDSRLGVVAALLPPALQQAAGGELSGSRMVQSLQEEGKKLKKFAEKKMRDGRPTHVSSMFLCQSCVKFLTVAAIMEGHPAKYSRESTSSMYSQTASLLDSCAHNAGRADGPPMITAGIALLAQRLAAVARLRAAYCLRTEGMQQVAAFRAALEKASGETYQRPSPTDSNTSTSISVPLDAASNAAAAAKPAGTAGSNPSRSSTPTGGRGRAAPPAAAAGGAKAPPAPAEALVGMPKAVLERQLLAAQHSQAMATALSAFAKSSERLREFMGQAAAQSNVQGLKVAAATLLLSADAGMGPAASVLAFAKDALDAVMQMQ